MRSLRIPLAAVASLLFVTAAGAGTANLITNPDFDTNLDGWSVYSGKPTFTLDSTAGEPSSPSGRLVTTGLGDTIGSTCIIIDSSQNFDFSANIRINSGGGVAALLGYTDAACKTIGNGPGPVAVTFTTNTWVHVSVVNTPVFLTWQSVRIMLSGNSLPGADVNFDHLQLSPTTTPVTLQSFEVN